jgi:hypothetical protein
VESGVDVGTVGSDAQNQTRIRAGGIDTEIIEYWKLHMYD